MHLSPEIESEIKDRAVGELVTMIWEKLEPDLKRMQLLTINRAAGMADVSVAQMNRLLDEHVDMGEQSKRVSIDQLERLITARTVRKGGRMNR